MKNVIVIIALCLGLTMTAQEKQTKNPQLQELEQLVTQLSEKIAEISTKDLDLPETKLEKLVAEIKKLNTDVNISQKFQKSIAFVSDDGGNRYKIKVVTDDANELKSVDLNELNEELATLVVEMENSEFLKELVEKLANSTLVKEVIKTKED